MDNEDEAADFLDRLDVDIDDVIDKTTFAKRLDDIFQENRIAFATRKQVDALFPIAEQKFFDFAPVGIRRVEFTIRGRPQTRFTLPQQRGLFNFKSALSFFRNLK